MDQLNEMILVRWCRHEIGQIGSNWSHIGEIMGTG